MTTCRRIPALRRIVTLLCFCALVWWPGTLTAQTVPSGFVVTPLEYWPDIAGMAFDDIGTMYVWERGGKVSIVENDVKRPTPLIDLTEEVGGWNDHGLLGFALHPNFRQNGYIYLMYVVDHHHLANFGTPSYNPNTNEFTRATIGRITRYTARASDNFRSVDPASRLVLLGETASTGCPILSITHGVGSLVFGTDGTLLASCGDGAMTGDSGSDPLSYYVNGLSEGIIRPKENIGAFRSQLIDSHSGKILRLDPATGDGVPSNPYYDPANPRAARSRVWNLGLRQPFRMTLKPGTGSHNPAAGDPGVLFLGEVGYSTWEALEISTGPSLNFGWPIYEGLDLSSEFFGDNPENQDAANPLFGINGCTQRYFRARDLLVQATLATPSWPNPCDASQQVPAAIPHFVHTRPVIDWRHGTGPSRTGIFSGTSAAVVNIGAAGSPISGPQFGGNCAVGGSFYQGTQFPATYQNSYFFADLGNGWIKNVTFDANGNPVSVRNFVDNAGGVTFVGIHPISGAMYYSRFWDGIHKVTYVGSGNQPPTAVASSNVSFGPSPRTVQFTGSASRDPEGLPLTYLWDFGDGSPSSTVANPSHTYNAPAGVPTRFDARLTVTDSAMATSSATVLISVNNTPPSVAITTPPDGTLYPLGTPTTYPLTAVVADSEHPDGQLLYQWQKTLHHNNHIHPDSIDTAHATSTLVTPIGCDGNLYFYRITLTVTDPAGLSGQDYVDVYPDCANTPPTISAMANLAIAQGSSTGPVAFTVGDAEIPAAFVTVTGSSSNTTLVPVANIVFGGSEGNRTVTVTPAANQSGTATITVTASDGQLSANSAFVLTVNGPTNTAPTISNILDGAVDLNTSTGPIAFTIGDAETAPGSLTLSGSSSNPTVVPNGNIVFGGSGANRTVTVMPAANQSGTATITITVSDGVLSAADTFVLVVGTATPDFSLVGAPASQTVAPGGSANYGLTISPTGGFSGSVTLSVSGLPAGATGSFSVNPATTSSTLTVSTSAATPAGTYTLTVTGISGSLTHTTTVTLAIGNGGGAPTSGQTAYLKFDESSGTTAADSSLSNNTGTLVGGPVWTAAGRVNGALSFDGINDYVSLASQSLAASFTLSAWVNVNSGSTEKTIFSLGNRSFYINDNVLSFWNNGSTGSGTFGTVPTGSWQHITFTYSGSVLRAYLNGVQLPTTVTSTVSTPSVGPRIGESGGDNFFSGSIDEFRLYNRALSAQEVLDVYNDTGVPPAPDTESPSTPTGLGTVAASASQIDLSWTASTDNVGVAGYRVFRCQGAGCTPSAEIGTSTTISYADTGLTASTTYTYAVAAFDAAGNASAASVPASATTQATVVDTTAPTVSMTAPANGVVVTGTAVTVSASASDNVGVSGVQFLLDGVSLGAEDTTAPYSITWNSTTTTSGLHTLSARARDAAGNTATASNVNVTVDNQAPTVPTGLGAAAASSTQINLSWTASTDNVGVTGYRIFRCQGAACTPSAQVATSTTNAYANTGLTASTTYTYAVAAFDAAGNASAASASVSATTQPAQVDTTAPTISVTAPAGGAVVRGTAIAVSASASDNVGVSGVQFLLDGVNLGAEDITAPYSITWNTTLTTSGPHVLAARARDAAGNIGTASPVNVTVDNQAPTGSILINNGATAVNTVSVTLNLSAADALGTVTQMRISNSTSFPAGEAYATTRAWTLSSGAGTKTVNVQFRDAAGNWSGTFSDTIVFETTAPTISAVAATGVTDGSATITWTTNELANSQVEYGPTTSYGNLTALDPILVTAHSAPLTGLNPQTTYNYRVRSTDAAGNQRVGTNQTFTTLAGPPDLSPPSVPTNLVAQAVSATQINLSWTASTDNVAVTGYRVFRNGAQIATVSTLTYASVNLTPNTSYSYTVAATDAQNNISAPSSPASATTLPDTTLPTVSITSPANNASVFASIAVTATANDNVGIAGVTFKVDGADIATEDTSSPYAVSLNTATLSDGSHTLTAVARDTSNNSATSAAVVITVNNTAPPMMIRYVNTASTAGGDGTTNGTAGANRAFRSLLEAINSLPNVLTMPVVIYCDGAGGPDTAPVNQAPFDMVTSAANYILVTTNAANRAKVPHDPARYTLTATNSNVLYNNIPSHIRFDGIQVEMTVTDGASYVAVKTSNLSQLAADIDARISNTVIRCVVTSGSAIGVHTGFPAAGAGGSSIVFNSVAYGCTSGFVNDFVGAVYANNTAFNSDYGFVDDAGSMKVVNCLAAKGSKAGSIGFVGTFAAGSDYNAEDDGNGAPGTNSRSGRTFTFVNAAIADVHLAPTDTGARDFGLSNPLPGKFTDDIDGILRSGLWDIGADEVGGGG